MKILSDEEIHGHPYIYHKICEAYIKRREIRLKEESIAIKNFSIASDYLLNKSQRRMF